jgi:hypothetical protein
LPCLDQPVLAKALELVVQAMPAEVSLSGAKVPPRVPPLDAV